jgi:choline dehydrogenase-like flavoprotein
MSAVQGRQAGQGTQRRFATTDPVDFVVVGSGTAGGSVARELTRLGHTVVLIEQGKQYTRADFTHDELGVIINNKYANLPPDHIQTWRKTPNDKAEQRHYLLYANAVGGSSMHYAANYWRFRPGDFNEFSGWGRSRRRPSIAPVPDAAAGPHRAGRTVGSGREKARYSRPPGADGHRVPSVPRSRSVPQLRLLLEFSLRVGRKVRHEFHDGA